MLYYILDITINYFKRYRWPVKLNLNFYLFLPAQLSTTLLINALLYFFNLARRKSKHLKELFQYFEVF